MLKNEFQSMIEQYSNELMNISRQSGGEVPANSQPISQEEVTANTQPIPQEEAAANAEPISQEEVHANSEPIPQEEAAVNAEPISQDQAAVNAETVPVQNPNVTQPPVTTAPNVMQAPTMPTQQNGAQPRDIPRNNAAVNNPPPVTNNFGKYRDDSANMTYEQFLSENPGSGLLKVQVFSGQQVSPIPNAEVVVSKELLEGTKIFFSGLTDISGIVDNIQLPAPDREISELPQPRGDGVDLKIPYSQYNVTVKEAQHIPQEYTHVPIFDGIKSIQPVRMTPIQFGNGNNETIVFPESEPNDL